MGKSGDIITWSPLSRKAPHMEPHTEGSKYLTVLQDAHVNVQQEVFPVSQTCRAVRHTAMCLQLIKPYLELLCPELIVLFI